MRPIPMHQTTQPATVVAAATAAAVLHPRRMTSRLNPVTARGGGGPLPALHAGTGRSSVTLAIQLVIDA